jgi:CheY-like chemotaxis protein
MALILVIDDNDLVRTLIRNILVTAGHKVVEAPDGEIALRLFRENVPDLVLTDIFMPEKEGIETIREVKKQRPELPIIAISGGVSNMDSSFTLVWAQRAGADRVIAKPFPNAALMSAVNDLLVNHEAKV